MLKSRQALSLVVASIILIAVIVGSLCRPGKCDGALYEFTLDPPACYVPTKVIFNFPTTTNATLQDVSTISQSPTGYSYEGTPTSFTFIAQEVDIYTFTLAIHYENVSASNQSRSVLISWWSGTLAPGGSSISSTQTDFVIHVRLSLTIQPTPPSAEEIAQEEWHLVEYTFAQMFNQLTAQNQQTADLSFKVTVLSLVLMAFASVAVFFALVAYKEKRKGG